MKELSLLLIGIIVLFICSNYLRRNLYLDKVSSSVNNKQYYVRNLPDKEEAANKLANIGIKLKKIIDSLDLKDKEKGEYNKKLKDNFNSDYITENKTVRLDKISDFPIYKDEIGLQDSCWYTDVH